MPVCTHNEFLSSEFSFAEFNLALDSRNTNSSPGLDGIDYYILKSSLKYKLILLDIFNEMFSTGKFPKNWKKSYVHFAEKPDGVSYRPIALTSSICKLFETIIKNKVQWWIETQNILPDNQSGFRKRQSCPDSVLNLDINIQQAFRQKKKNYMLCF